MGYKLTSLVNLPFDERIEMYVFVIGDQIWEGGLEELVHRNFDKIAYAIGPNAIIVGALQASFHGEVVEHYLGRNYATLKNELPALLITDVHPDKLTSKSLRILIPLKRAQEVYTQIDDFFSDLVGFVRGDSDELLRALEAAPSPIELVDDVVKFSLPVVPGFISVNLNNYTKQLRDWWNRNYLDRPQKDS